MRASNLNSSTHFNNLSHEQCIDRDVGANQSLRRAGGGGDELERFQCEQAIDDSLADPSSNYKDGADVSLSGFFCLCLSSSFLPLILLTYLLAQVTPEEEDVPTGGIATIRSAQGGKIDYTRGLEAELSSDATKEGFKPEDTNDSSSSEEEKEQEGWHTSEDEDLFL